MKNTIRQSVTTLDLVVFRGNQLHLLVTLPDDFVMPDQIRWKFVDGGMYSAIAQPTLSVQGKTIEMRLETNNLPERGCTHTLYFDGRAVLAGGVITNRQTTSSPAGTDQHIHLTVDEITPVNVQMITTVLDPTGAVVNQADSYVHTQSIPATTWLVQHDLGKYPGGIIVKDSAGNQWAFDVDYLSDDQLQLSFGSCSFAGIAYIS